MNRTLLTLSTVGPALAVPGDMGDDDAAQPSCDATALVVGAVVHEADLVVGSGGSQFQKIDLAV